MTLYTPQQVVVVGYFLFNYFTVYSKFLKQAIPISVLSTDLFTYRILKFIQLIFLHITVCITVCITVKSI